MKAVASVIKNRADNNFNNLGSDPVAQATAKSQFNGQSKPSNAALVTAAQLLSGKLEDNTSGALFFANPSASSAKWAKNLSEDNSLKIGNHYFTDNVAGVPFTASGSVGKEGPSTFDKVSQQAAAIAPNQLAQVYQAYKSGSMAPADRAQFEHDVNSGLVMLPQGASLETKAKTPHPDSAVELPQPVIEAYNKAAADPYNQSLMPVNQRQQLDADLKNGIVKLPQGATLNQTYPSIVDKAKEMVTGEGRSTPMSKQLPEITEGNPHGALLEGVSPEKGLLMSSALLTATDPNQMAEILKNGSPNIRITRDDHGNIYAANTANGAEFVLNRPGLSKMDILQGIGLGAAFTPAAKAATIGGAALASGATQAAIEASHAAAGGSADLMAIPVAAATGGAVPAVVNTVRAAAAPAKALLNSALGREAAPLAETVAEGAAPEAAAAVAPKPVAPEAAPVAAEVKPAVQDAAPAPNQTFSELTQTTKKAAEGDNRAVKILTGETSPNAETLQSAKELGVEHLLDPDHVTTNQAFREIAQGVKSFPGSEARAQEATNLKQVAARADKLVEELGGTHDLSQLSGDVKSSLNATQQELDKQAEQLYGKLHANIPAKAPVEANNVLDFVKQRADELGGAQNLSPMEKQILAKLGPKAEKAAEVALPAEGSRLTAQDYQNLIKAKNAAATGATSTKMPTYALLDDVRRDIGSGLKNAGPFKDEDIGLKKKLYSLISEDQANVAAQHGMGDTFTAAKQAVQVRKGIENDLTNLFGKHLDASMVQSVNSAMGALVKGDNNQLINLLKSVPANMRQSVVASGLNMAFGRSAARQELSFTHFAKWYEGLAKNKQSFNAVMSNLPPEATRQLQNLYNVSKGISQATGQKIATGRLAEIRKAFEGQADGLLDKLYSVANKAGKGFALEAATSALGMHGAGIGAALTSALVGGKTNALKAADALLASPDFRAAAMAGASGDTKAAAQKIAYSKPFLQFVRSVGNPREMTNKEQWVMKALQKRNQSRNEDKK
jgi:hypothetical protein